MYRILVIILTIFYYLLISLCTGIGIIWLIDTLYTDKKYEHSKYLKEMQCYKYGQISNFKIYYNTKTNKCKVQIDDKLIELNESEYVK